MLDYLLLGSGTGVLRVRTPMRAEGDVTVSAPIGATVFWNGKAFTADGGVATIPAACLRARNTVRLVTADGSFRCEGVGFDGACLTPLGFDRDALLLSLAEAVVSVLGTLDDLAAWVLSERKRRENTLFS